MRAASGPGVVFASGGSSDIAFTDLHAAPDAMFGVAKLLELLARAEANLEEIGNELPTIPYISCTISCPVERKGTLMRRFAEMAQEYKASFREGVKIQLDHGWVLLRADRTAPRLHLVVEADSSQRASSWLRKYQEMVEQWVREEG
jgi:mannose-1-phosphate guanylyltransferase/phosphomannomutase